MSIKTISIVVFIANLSIACQVMAHHSFAAEFDASSPISLFGTVLKVEWTNPHTYFFIEVVNDEGEYEEWALEMGSPNGLMRRGWTRNTLQIGEEIMITGTRARDGSNKANIQAVIIATTCQRLFAGTSQNDFDESESESEECEL